MVIKIFDDDACSQEKSSCKKDLNEEVFFQTFNILHKQNGDQMECSIESGTMSNTGSLE